MVAAKLGSLAVVRYLAEQGADIDYAETNGFTPLQVALAHGRAEVVAYLLWAGATPPLFQHREIPTNG
jgi:hypothetical protein